ncbi:sulfatase [Chloroflexota bacterium]
MNRNVILITIDCLRADHLGCYGYGRETSPFLDQLAANGVTFQNAFANGPFTAAAFLSILASAYPLDFEHQTPLPKKAVLISETLKAKGIATAAIHSNPYLSAFYGYNRGWDYFEDFMYPTIGKRGNTLGRVVPERVKGLYQFLKLCLFGVKPFENAAAINTCAINWLNQNKDSSFFAWLHYMDIHEPYLVYSTGIRQKDSKNISRISQIKSLINSQKGKLTPEDLRNFVAIYDDKLRYIDEQLKSLVNFLKNNELLDNTLLIITSDHGQEFLDHGGFGHVARFYDELIHIPLILSGPEIAGHSDDSLVSQIDICPTILHFYGIPSPIEYQGCNLLENSDREYIISEAAHNERGVYLEGNKIYPSEFRTYAIRTERWKYIGKYRNSNSIGSELYDLQNDPQEKIDIASTRQQVTREFAQILDYRLSKRTVLRLKRKIRKRL